MFFVSLLQSILKIRFRNKSIIIMTVNEFFQSGTHLTYDSMMYILIPYKKLQQAEKV